jgi:hypothetical protein
VLLGGKGDLALAGVEIDARVLHFVVRHEPGRLRNSHGIGNSNEVPPRKNAEPKGGTTAQMQRYVRVPTTRAGAP